MVNPFELIESTARNQYNKLPWYRKVWYKVTPWLFGLAVVAILVGAGIAIDHFLIK